MYPHTHAFTEDRMKEKKKCWRRIKQENKQVTMGRRTNWKTVVKPKMCAQIKYIEPKYGIWDLKYVCALRVSCCCYCCWTIWLLFVLQALNRCNFLYTLSSVCIGNGCTNARQIRLKRKQITIFGTGSPPNEIDFLFVYFRSCCKVSLKLENTHRIIELAKVFFFFLPEMSACRIELNAK